MAAFIRPVMAAYNLSSLMLGSSRLPFYSPVSFVFRQWDGPATHFMSLFPRWNPAGVAAKLLHVRNLSKKRPPLGTLATPVIEGSSLTVDDQG
jgi:hypothetical protein